VCTVFTVKGFGLVVKISLPTGRKGSCQEVGRMYLRGWAMQ